MEKVDKPHDSEEKKPSFLDPKFKTGKTYTVKAGDTLLNIAKKFYGEDADYQKIYDANKDLIGSDPNMIKVGQELTIPPK